LIEIVSALGDMSGFHRALTHAADHL